MIEDWGADAYANALKVHEPSAATWIDGNHEVVLDPAQIVRIGGPSDFASDL